MKQDEINEQIYAKKLSHLSMPCDFYNNSTISRWELTQSSYPEYSSFQWAVLNVPLFNCVLYHRCVLSWLTQVVSKIYSLNTSQKWHKYIYCPFHYPAFYTLYTHYLHVLYTLPLCENFSLIWLPNHNCPVFCSSPGHGAVWFLPQWASFRSWCSSHLCPLSTVRTLWS